jgi:hypothetical protein
MIGIPIPTDRNEAVNVRHRTDMTWVNVTSPSPLQDLSGPDDDFATAKTAGRGGS